MFKYSVKVIVVLLLFVSFSYSIDDSFYDLDGDVLTTQIYDPLENFNRTMLDFDLWLLDNVGNPIDNTYNLITTQGIRKSVSNFVTNLNMPLYFLNSVLQLDLTNSVRTLYSFIFNSTFGIFGLFDVAELDYRKNNFDNTLSFYGVPSGPYLVLPIIGPTTLRGLTGDVVELFVDPFSGFYIGNRITNNGTYLVKSVLSGTNKIHFVFINYYDLMNVSLDEYNFVRDAYFQYKSKNRVSRF
ncbi:MAG: VacJ family lipoprotein [Rickettsiales bacterium]|jgi:phospholipid-binding lipoprotein MlaA|nr:VacJ family lipoprotein [Rickettsiales bacterium]